MLKSATLAMQEEKLSQMMKLAANELSLGGCQECGQGQAAAFLLLHLRTHLHKAVHFFMCFIFCSSPQCFHPLSHQGELDPCLWSWVHQRSQEFECGAHRWQGVAGVLQQYPISGGLWSSALFPFYLHANSPKTTSKVQVSRTVAIQKSCVFECLKTVGSIRDAKQD